MNNLLLIAHGRRYNDKHDYDDFNKSHFKVKKGFNIITFHKPGKEIFKELGVIIQEQLPLNYQKILETIKDTLLKERRKQINLIENLMIINFLNNKLDNLKKNLISSGDLSNKKNKIELLLEPYFFVKNIETIEQAKKIILDNIIKIKERLNFEIRVYPEETQAPILDISFAGGVESFSGIFDIKSLPENLFDKDEENEDFEIPGMFSIDTLMEPSVPSILKHSIIKKFDINKTYKLEDILEILTSKKLTGNLFIFSCGTYYSTLPKRSLLRQKSDQLQGFKYKYLKYKKKYIELKQYLLNKN